MFFNPIFFNLSTTPKNLFYPNTSSGFMFFFLFPNVLGNSAFIPHLPNMPNMHNLHNNLQNVPHLEHIQNEIPMHNEMPGELSLQERQNELRNMHHQNLHYHRHQPGYYDNSFRHEGDQINYYNYDQNRYANGGNNYIYEEDQYQNYYMTERHPYEIPRYNYETDRRYNHYNQYNNQMAGGIPRPPAPPTPGVHWGDSFPHESSFRGQQVLNDMYAGRSMKPPNFLPPNNWLQRTTQNPGYLATTSTKPPTTQNSDSESSESEEYESRKEVISVKEAFVRHELDVDSFIKPPDRLVRVKYRSFSFFPGDQLEPGTVIPTPEASWSFEEGALYTLLMYDPDIPARSVPILRSFLHWLVVNIPGDDVKEGDEVATYLTPFALPKTGVHRYTFLVFKQRYEIELQDIMLTGAEARVKFSISEFAQKHHLGEPVAGNFFLYEINDEPDALHKLKKIIAKYTTNDDNGVANNNNGNKSI